MAGYKLATYQSADGPRAGLIVDDKVFDAAKLTGKASYATVIGILADWRAAHGALKKATAKAGRSKTGQPLGRTKLLRAGAVAVGDLLCRCELRRSRRRNGSPHEPAARPDPHTLGLKAWHFIKGSRALADPGATVKISDVSNRVDWEVELAAVIGRPAKNVPQEKALDYVAGYTIANDLRRATAGTAPISAKPRRSSPIGPSTRPSTAPARSAPGSCRQATSAIRRISASSCGSTTSSSRTPTART